MNHKQVAGVVAILVGMVVSVGGAIMPRMLPQEMFWNQEQAGEQSRASARLHQETFEAAQAQVDKRASQEEKIHAAQELAAAKERFEVSRGALDRAQFWRSTLPNMIRWVGAGIAVLGAIFWMASRPSD